MPTWSCTPPGTVDLCLRDGPSLLECGRWNVLELWGSVAPLSLASRMGSLRLLHSITRCSRGKEPMQGLLAHGMCVGGVRDCELDGRTLAMHILLFSDAALMFVHRISDIAVWNHVRVRIPVN